MSNIVNKPPTKESGLYKDGYSHAEGGIQVVVDNSKKIEVENDEYSICRDAMESTDIHKFSQKTNKEVLDSLFRGEGCTFEQGKENGGNFIICKVVVLDEKKYDREGTVKQILNQLQSEKSCNMTADSGGSSKNTYGGLMSVDGIPSETFTDEADRLRFEIDDSTAIIDENYLNNIIEAVEKRKISFEPKLENILKSWDGYNHYPDLKNIDLVFHWSGYKKYTDGKEVEYIASHEIYPNRKENININCFKLIEDYVKYQRIHERTPKVSKESEIKSRTRINYVSLVFRRKLFHELQHAIQKRIGIVQEKSDKEAILKNWYESSLKQGESLSDFKKRMIVAFGGEDKFESEIYKRHKLIPNEKEAYDVEARIEFSKEEREAIRPIIEKKEDEFASGGGIGSILREVIFTKKVNPSFKFIVRTFPDGTIKEMDIPNGVRFPFSIGQVLNRNHETWACVNGYLVNGKDMCGEEKIFGIKVSDVPQGHEWRIIYPHKFKNEVGSETHAGSNPIEMKSSGGVAELREEIVEEHESCDELETSVTDKEMFSHISAEHIEGGKVIKEILKSAEEGEPCRERILAFWEDELKHHLGEEEIEVFPIMIEKHPSVKLIIDDLIVDHNWLMSIIEKMQSNEVGNEEYCIEFCERIKQHIVKEEKLFKDYMNMFKDGGGVESENKVLLAPNGKPSNLNSVQYNLVRTPEFISWFGDWINNPSEASKVVDENGEPLVVYHGTYKEFYVFGEGQRFKNVEHIKNTNYFHKSKKYVEKFGFEKPYFLNVKNIELIEQPIMEKFGYFKEVYDQYVLKGVDGVYTENGEYATIISANQIKLADGSNTTFDGSNPDIRFKDGGDVDSLFSPYIDKGSIIDDEEILKKYNLKRFVLQNKYGIGHLDLVETSIKGSGIGTILMNDLIKFADKNNITLALTPSTDFGATSVNRLKDFYKKFGFVENKGKNKVWNTTSSMVREPKINTNKEFSTGGGIEVSQTPLIQVEPAIRKILVQLDINNNKALIVGGAVRDAIMEIEPKDIDIEVYNISYDDLNTFLSQYGKVDLVGKSFGVIKFSPYDAEMDYDFSVPRKENRMGVGHKGFEVTFDENMTIEESAIRRDFTMNALAYDPLYDQVYDYFGGIDDIKNKIIRHTSDKFGEDALRILRAMQFSARFGFSIHPDTIIEIQNILKTDEFSLIPKERVYEEWKKWAEKGVHHDLLFKFLRDTNLIDYYPMLKALKETPQDEQWHPEGDVEIHTTLCQRYMDKIISANGITGNEKVILVMSILLHDIGKPDTTKEEMKRGRMSITSNGHEALGGYMSKDFLEGLGFHESLITPICNLVTNHLAGVSISSIPKESGKIKAVKKLSRRLAPATINQLLLVMEADHNGRGSDVYKEPTGAKELSEIAGSINIVDKQYEYLLMGRHLIEAGLKPSKQFGEILSKANEAQENGEFSDVEGAKKWLNENLDSLKNNTTTPSVSRMEIVDVPDDDVSKYILDGGIFDLEMSKEFSKKWLGYTIVSEVDSGTKGTVFNIDNGQVLKITTSKNEAEFCNELIGKHLKHHVDVYSVKQIGTEEGLYMIERAYLENLTKDDKASYRMMLGHEHSVSREGFQERIKSEIVDLRAEEEEKLINLFDDFRAMIQELKELGLTPNDFFPENVGFKDGKVACFDCKYKDGGEVTTLDTFEKWFGKSKVLDADGKPLIVYHGSGTIISEFSHEFSGQGNEQLGSGFYFTTDETEAERYTLATIKGKEKLGGTDNPSVVKVFLKIEKPLKENTPDTATKKQIKQFISSSPIFEQVLGDFGDIEYDGRENIINDVVDNYYQSYETLLRLINTIGNDFFKGHEKELLEGANKIFKYDGVEHQHENGIKHYVAWFPTQIKLADGSNTTFDAKNSDIRFELGGTTTIETTDVNEYYKKGGELRFYSDCVGYPVLSDLEHIIEHEREITRSTFISNVNTDDRLMVERQLGYSRSFPIEKDWHVRFFKSKDEDNNTVYFIRHSAIEYVFSKKGDGLSCNYEEYKKGGHVIYHGSPYDIEKFSTKHMGKGEGSASYGWGLYFTDKKSIAQDYAERLVGGVNEAYNDIAKIYFEMNKDLTKTKAWFTEALKNPKDYKYVTDYWNSKHILTIKKFISGKIDIKDIASRNIYKVKIDKIDDDNSWLVWDVQVSDVIFDKIESQAKKEKNTMLEMTAKDFNRKNMMGEWVYKNIATILNSDKEASLFLLRSGIIGMKYPNAGIEKGYYYIVFDEKAIAIENKEVFEDGGGISEISEAIDVESITDTEEFKEWFGNSKMTDSQRNPSIFYHQTDKNNLQAIEENGFDLSIVGARAGDEQMPDGVFVKRTDEDISVGATPENVIQIPVFVKAENPIYFDSRTDLVKYLSSDFIYDDLQFQRWKYDKEMDKKVDAMYKDESLTKYERGTPEWKVEFNANMKKIKDTITDWGLEVNNISALARKRATELFNEEGYDTVIVRNDIGSFNRSTWTMVVLNPTHVKSAVNNIGTFDITKSGIKYDDGGEMLLVYFPAEEIIGKKYKEVFPKPYNRSTPAEYRVLLKNYDGTIERLKKDEYKRVNEKTHDKKRAEWIEKNIERFKYFAGIRLDNTGTITEVNYEVKKMEDGGGIEEKKESYWLDDEKMMKPRNYEAIDRNTTKNTIEIKYNTFDINGRDIVMSMLIQFGWGETKNEGQNLPALVAQSYKLDCLFYEGDHDKEAEKEYFYDVDAVNKEAKWIFDNHFIDKTQDEVLEYVPTIHSIIIDNERRLLPVDNEIVTFNITNNYASELTAQLFPTLEKENCECKHESGELIIIEARTISGLTFDFDVQSYLTIEEVRNVAVSKSSPSELTWFTYKGNKFDKELNIL